MEVRKTGKNWLEAEEKREEAGSGNQAWVEREQRETGLDTEDKKTNPKRLRKRQRETGRPRGLTLKAKNEAWTGV